MINEIDAREIANDFGKTVGLAAFQIDGEFLFEQDDRSIWRVFLWFDESDAFELQPAGAAVDIDAMTGQVVDCQGML